MQAIPIVRKVSGVIEVRVSNAKLCTMHGDQCQLSQQDQLLHLKLQPSPNEMTQNRAAMHALLISLLLALNASAHAECLKE